MTVQTKTRTAKTGFSLPGKLRTWLAAFEQATAYDPHVQAAETIRQLRQSIASLEARMGELDMRDST